MRYILILMSVLFISCAANNSNIQVPQPYQYQDEELYDIQDNIEKIPKPDPIDRLYATQKNDTLLVLINDVSQAKYFVLTPDEYQKINILKELAISYKSVLLDQEKLVNLKINKINLLQSLMENERQARIASTEAWIQTDDSYNKEKRDHRVDKIIDTTTNYILLGFSIIMISMSRK